MNRSDLKCMKFGPSKNYKNSGKMFAGGMSRKNNRKYCIVYAEVLDGHYKTLKCDDVTGVHYTKLIELKKIQESYFLDFRDYNMEREYLISLKNNYAQ